MEDFTQEQVDHIVHQNGDGGVRPTYAFSKMAVEKLAVESMKIKQSKICMHRIHLE